MSMRRTAAMVVVVASTRDDKREDRKYGAMDGCCRQHGGRPEELLERAS